KFPTINMLDQSKTMEIRFTATSGAESLAGKLQSSYIDMVTPGLSYPQVSMQCTDGNADGNAVNGNIQTLYITDASAGGSLEVSPIYTTPDPSRVSLYTFTATETPLMPPGSPGVDTFRLAFTKPNFAMYSVQSVKVGGSTASYTLNSAYPLGTSPTLEIKLSSPLTVSFTPVEVVFRTRSTTTEVTARLVCDLANSQNLDYESAGSLEVKSGYPILAGAAGSADTTLEVMANATATGKHNVPTDSDVQLRYSSTLKLTALNVGVNKLRIQYPSTSFSYLSVDSVWFGAAQATVSSATASGGTIEILLAELYNFQVTAETKIKVYFSGHTTTTVDQSLYFGLFADHSIASKPIQCQGALTWQKLTTKRLLTSASLKVSPN
ncbi:MAG: hypothetical protein PHQ23_09285, partial [Candidatus Wallbacteria bacterium]|nr:hypothetical protein [Candidatus Wallbacteria bacterium]